jgi:hypothetical protein
MRGGDEQAFEAVQSNCPSVMLPCIDDEEPAPAIMPYADDSDDSLFEYRELPRGSAKFEEAAAEESDLPTPGFAPACREDPAYHLQYPGCPFIGPAPHAPGMTPIFKEMSRPKDHRRPSLRYDDPALAPPKESRSKKCLEGDDCPAHPEVDTMEFRKSDAKVGEFDRSPFNKPY